MGHRRHRRPYGPDRRGGIPKAEARGARTRGARARGGEHRMKRFFSALGRVVLVLALDAAGIAGAGLIAYGAWLVHEPAGFIVGGAELVALATFAGRGVR